MVADRTRIVGLSGSLRAQSLVPSGTETVLFEGIGNLPPFNPDLDQEGDVPPPAVAELGVRARPAGCVQERARLAGLER
jgi:hypothetical protein